MRNASVETSGFCATPHPSRPRTRAKTVVVKPMSASQWRVCDPRLPGDDPHHLLGFIEITKSLEFEAMSLIRGFEWFTYSTLAEATTHFANAMHEGSQSDPESHVFSHAATTQLVG